MKREREKEVREDFTNWGEQFAFEKLRENISNANCIEEGRRFY